MLPLPYPFDRDYMQLALVAGLAVGATAPLIGAFLVQKRLSLLGDGMGHLAFAGVAAGLLLGVWPVPIALAVAVAGAVAIERLRRGGRTSGDLALALVFYSGIAAGVVLAGRSGSFNASILGYLFGSVLTVSNADAITVVVLGLAVLIVLAVMGRVLFAVVLDEESARVAGLPVDGVNTLLAVLAAVTVVAAMRVVGVLLVAAMMVLPVAASQVVASSFRRAVTLAMAIGVGAVVVGLGLARVWALPPGGTIVLVTAAVYAVLSVVRSTARSAIRFRPRA
ncbi:MAG: zinc transport system permease protein [Acidimicrobiaceae bacterium]|jgi:zinc transport system permease protein|nr:zinc transport system permease protein [Acidimicrobiaceae bacterium]